MKYICVRGAAEHNLKNISLDIPRDRLTVFTGVSGSGKSSLAFDTIYKEGRRRFLESLSSYARQFLGGFEKPQLEGVEGLSPAVSIDQKTVARNARSTVGTITEIYDHLRLLYARLGLPHCPECGKPVRSQSPQQVIDQLLARFSSRRVLLCAPVVLDRKGGHRRELGDLRRDGYRRLRIDGKIVHLGREEIQLTRQQAHTIEVVYDRLDVRPESRTRLEEAVEKCFALADGKVNVVVVEGPAHAEAQAVPEEHVFSGRFACPTCGVDLPELEPRLFSFNTCHGACPDCQGLGETTQLDVGQLVADPSLPLGRGGLAVFSCRRSSALLPRKASSALKSLLGRHGHGLEASWGDLDETARRELLYGDDAVPGLVALVSALGEKKPESVADFYRDLPCPSCGGSRLSPLARAVTFQGRALHELCALPLGDLEELLGGTELEGVERTVGEPILAEVRARLRFLNEVGLSYLTLSRSSESLAGGEAQRIRLATQVGAGLQGVLFVLDEPSIGLHSRDNQRLLRTLTRLRDTGNTVFVVEHDRETMLAADHIVDLGPGAGVHGGEVVATGSAGDLAREPRSITGDFLAARSSIDTPARRRDPGGKWLELFEVRHNNLKGIDVRIPLELLVVVTGVSGSGKSSLINQVLRPALLKKLGRRGLEAGRHRSLRGYQHLDKLVVVDQSPIGKTPRSNPATYTKVFDHIRQLFAQLPLARTRGYSPGRFSFNVQGGRCLECGGSGVRIVDMQFLAPVEIVCDACGGRRYNRETLEVLYQGRNIHEVLELTVGEAFELFRHHPRVVRSLEVLDRVGLGYLRLGQTSTTLSGGESQRLKLASELQKRETGRTLYILDEPTTGLHFHDIKALLEALYELVERGNSVIVIEHNLDVVKYADYVIDLGPEGGEEGGEIVAVGTPEAISEAAGSHTGAALRPALEPPAPIDPSSLGREEEGASRVAAPGLGGDLIVEEAHQHNLQGVSVRIPHNRLTVITGVSGSGKSSLAFDTVFAEGQRRYTESLSTYARQFLGRLQKPTVKKITGLAPAIAIDQRSLGGGRRSTVSTTTEIQDYLRLLFARVGRPHCPVCGLELTSTSPTRLAEELVRNREGDGLHVLAPLDVDDQSEADVSSLTAMLLKSGFTRVLAGDQEIRLDEGGSAPIRRILNACREARDGPERISRFFVVVDRVVARATAQSRLAGSLEQAFEKGGGVVALKPSHGDLEFFTRAPSCARQHFSFRGQLTPRMFSFNSPDGACERCKGTGLEERLDLGRAFPHAKRPILKALHPALLSFLERYSPAKMQILKALLAERRVPADTPYGHLRVSDREALLYGEGAEQVELEHEGARFAAQWGGLVDELETWLYQGSDWFVRPAIGRFFHTTTCSACGGGRLRSELLQVRIGGLNIHEITGSTIADARRFFDGIVLAERERVIARDALKEINNRLRFLDEVGLGYLTLHRSTSTLSGGEAQRLRLASQLGNRLAGVLYVLDEPTVGLHQRDTQRLLSCLRDLRDHGNTIIMVEHDRETMEAADHIIDLGPGAGERGGRVIACGTLDDVRAARESLTGKYLRDEDVEIPRQRRRPGARSLELRGVRCHNIDGMHASFPLGLLTAVTGVSGSGKSTLVMDVLATVVRSDRLGAPSGQLVEEVNGLEHVKRLAVVDQRPLGRTPRSTPATYTGVWELVRNLYASLPLSKVRGYGPGRFSFNSPEGRCLDCAGQGATVVEMHFLSDVWVVCDACGGRRFDSGTLDICFKGRNVSDVLEMEVDEALEFFRNQPRLRRILKTLQDVGAGYLKLGQSAHTLSGGEAQRLKLARELVEKDRGGNVYILDEPTTGLHFEDIRKLLNVLETLVEHGHTVIVIEHQLDVVAAADWIIDLGPEGGCDGGRIVAAGPPEEVAEVEESHTGRYLRTYLGRLVRRSPATG